MKTVVLQPCDNFDLGTEGELWVEEAGGSDDEGVITITAYHPTGRPPRVFDTVVNTNKSNNSNRNQLVGFLYFDPISSFCPFFLLLLSNSFLREGEGKVRENETIIKTDRLN